MDHRLKDLKLRIEAIVDRVEDMQAADPIAARLRDLGFVSGEPVRVVARGPIGGDPLVVQMAEKADGQKVWFSMDPSNPIVREHVRNGGIAGVLASIAETVSPRLIPLPLAQLA